MRGTDENSLLDGMGCAVVERQLLETLKHLWDGPLEPSELERIEKSLRAIITGKTLVVARFHDAWDGSDVGYVVKGDHELELPFGDHFLDYEFVPPDQPQPFRYPDKQEESSLEKFVGNALSEAAVSVLPRWISRRSEAFAFWDAWYRGQPLDECEGLARLASRWQDGQDGPFDRSERLHSVFHGHPITHAKYLVGCQRGGAVVYGDSPVAEICSEHLFARWPEEILLR
ncbi:MAG: hypothetical protein OXH52_06755 [Gammaproteobacteria bacterium]|nr:hypothetical protein [Gammaproteobacteria bacterium]